MTTKNKKLHNWCCTPITLPYFTSSSSLENQYLIKLWIHMNLGIAHINVAHKNIAQYSKEYVLELLCSSLIVLNDVHCNCSYWMDQIIVLLDPPLLLHNIASFMKICMKVYHQVISTPPNQLGSLNFFHDLHIGKHEWIGTCMEIGFFVE
jgi:hypothetical protein